MTGLTSNNFLIDLAKPVKPPLLRIFLKLAYFKKKSKLAHPHTLPTTKLKFKFHYFLTLISAFVNFMTKLEHKKSITETQSCNALTSDMSSSNRATPGVQHCHCSSSEATEELLFSWTIYKITNIT